MAGSDIKKRVAVIAVHGVAYHAPTSSARAVSDLLVNSNLSSGDEQAQRLPSKATPYTPSREVPINIDVQPLTLTGVPQSATSIGTDPSIEFMRELLDHYQPTGDDGVYSTTYFETQRLDAGRKPTADVHVYEMYWNDLSRVGTGILGFFSSLYLLLFHIGDLGVLTVDIQKKAHPEDRLLAAHAACQRLANNLLTLPVPLLNLVMLAVGAPIFVCQMPVGSVANAVAAGVPAVAALALVGKAAWYFFQRGARGTAIRRPPILEAGLAFLLAIAFGGIAFAAVYRCLSPSTFGEATYSVLASEVAFLLLGAVVWISRTYQRYRPGSAFFGMVLSLLAFVLFTHNVEATFRVASGNTALGVHTAIAQAVVSTLSEVYGVLFAVWTAFLVAMWVAVIVGLCARLALNGCDTEGRARFWRSWWTGLIALALPALLTLALTLTLWSAIASRTDYAWQDQEKINAIAGPATGATVPKPVTITEVYPVMRALKVAEANPGVVPLLTTPDTYRISQYEVTPIGRSAQIAAHSYVIDLVEATATPLLWLDIVFVAIALALCLWALLPTVLREINPPRKVSDKMQGLWGGRWLTDGYWAAGAATGLLFVVIAVLVPLGYFVPLLSERFPSSPLWHVLIRSPVTKTAVNMSSESAATATGLAALATLLTQLGALSGKAGSLVGVALDVDNHLRSVPKERTPRARMAARYVSLLRYLSRWRDEEGLGYDGIVIVAHSQGTVLTADLLRFLHVLLPVPAFQQNENALAQLLQGPPIYFYSMGCPLRQLYGLRFPLLYGWARVDHAQPGGTCLPSDLGVDKWVNVYRTSDAVGRALWQSDIMDDPAIYTYNPVPLPRVVGSFENCIGAGGHTHYWDDTAPEVAREIDRLIEAIPQPLPAPGGPAGQAAHHAGLRKQAVRQWVLGISAASLVAAASALSLSKSWPRSEPRGAQPGRN